MKSKDKLWIVDQVVMIVVMIQRCVYNVLTDTMKMQDIVISVKQDALGVYHWVIVLNVNMAL